MLLIFLTPQLAGLKIKFLWSANSVWYLINISVSLLLQLSAIRQCLQETSIIWLLPKRASYKPIYPTAMDVSACNCTRCVWHLGHFLLRTKHTHRHRHRHPYATGASFYEQKRRCWWCDTDTLQKVQAIALKASTGRTRVASNFNCNPMANRWQTAGQTAGQGDG